MKMNGIKQAFSDFIKDEEGASGIEYALVAAMVAIGIVTFVTPVRTAIVGVFTDIQTALEGAGSSGGA